MEFTTFMFCDHFGCGGGVSVPLFSVLDTELEIYIYGDRRQQQRRVSEC